MKYDAPQLDSRYQNFIGGEWTEPRSGKYFENPSPVNGQTFCEVPRSGADDIELALDAALPDHLALLAVHDVDDEIEIAAPRGQ